MGTGSLSLSLPTCSMSSAYTTSLQDCIILPAVFPGVFAQSLFAPILSPCD